MAGFIDTMRSEGYAVESICRVLREQGCQVAARTYRSWRRQGPAVRTITDAHVMDTVRSAVWTADAHGRRKMTPEGLYGRRKMTALLHRTMDPDVSAGSVDRAMRALGLSGVRRDKSIRTTIPAKDGKRAGDLLNRDFTAQAPNRVWVTDFTYVRAWAGWVSTSSSSESIGTGPFSSWCVVEDHQHRGRPVPTNGSDPEWGISVSRTEEFQ